MSAELKLCAYSDADFAARLDTRKSISGVLIKLAGAPLHWKSTKQKIVSESTTEAEFVACSLTSRDVKWFRTFLDELGFTEKEPTKVYVDNQAALKLAVNNQVHSSM